MGRRFTRLCREQQYDDSLQTLSCCSNVREVSEPKVSSYSEVPKISAQLSEAFSLWLAFTGHVSRLSMLVSRGLGLRLQGYPMFL